MAFAHVVSYIALATVFSTCLCLPLKTEKDSDKTEMADFGVDKIVPEVVTDVLDEAFVVIPEVTMSDKESEKIVKRSARAGIISGAMCPQDEWRMPSGECVPCNGQNYPGCPATEGDYYDENEVE